MPESHRPLLDFMVIGTQKGGTKALHRFLGQHPEIGVSSRKEVHLFDAPEYSEAWTPEQIDERYRPFFEHCPDARVRGEATPIYLYFPEIARELARYHPELKLIVLLRDPVERAFSHYYDGERARLGTPCAVVGAALRALPLASVQGPPCRPFGDAGGFLPRPGAVQPAVAQPLSLLRDREQVLILWNRDLREDHDAVLRRVFAFLGVSGEIRIAPGVHNEGKRSRRRHRLVSSLLRISYLAEFARMRALLSAFSPRERRG